MAIPSWPAGLPPLVGILGTEGTAQLYEPPRETSFDDGPVRTRRQTLIVAVPRTITLPPLDKAQFGTFLAFVRDDLNMGARRFTGPVRLPDGTLGTRTCRILGKVAEGDLGRGTRISFTIAVYDW